MRNPSHHRCGCTARAPGVHHGNRGNKIGRQQRNSATRKIHQQVVTSEEEPVCTYRPLVQLFDLARESGREYKTANRVT